MALLAKRTISCFTMYGTMYGTSNAANGERVVNCCMFQIICLSNLLSIYIYIHIYILHIYIYIFVFYIYIN